MSAAAGATFTLLEEIRARRERDEEAWAERQYKRSVKAQNRQQQNLFDEGRREERAKAKTKAKGSTHPAAGRKSSSSAKRRRTPATVRQAQRQLAAPVRAQTVSAMRSVGLGLAVIALYQVLANAGAVAGVLGGLGRGFEWLSSPDRSIPYAPPS